MGKGRKGGGPEPPSVVSTLSTTCSIICRPLLPGYLPAMFSADRLKRLAPVSVQMAWTSIFFPTPDGPASSRDFTRGACSCTAAEPEGAEQTLQQPVGAAVGTRGAEAERPGRAPTPASVAAAACGKHL